MDITEIPVMVSGREKWVTGLTKRTTCDDIIYALLYNDSNGNSSDEQDIFAYTILERWRDVERPLQGRTKILKVWQAWDNEQQNVTFTMRKAPSNDNIESGKTRKRRIARRRSKRERREKPKEKPTGAKQQIDALVQKIIAQEKTVQHQMNRLAETDKEIEEYETRVHRYRVQELGENYVQETYLKDQKEINEVFKDLNVAEKEQYKDVCEHILHLEELLCAEDRKIENLSLQVDEASFMTYVGNLDSSMTSSSDQGINSPDVDVQEAFLLESALQKCVAVGAEQKNELERVNVTLTQCAEQLSLKQIYLVQLRREVGPSEPDTQSLSDLEGDYAVLDRNYANTTTSRPTYEFGDVAVTQYLGTGGYRYTIDAVNSGSVSTSSQHGAAMYMNGQLQLPTVPYVTVLRREPPSHTEELLRAKLNKHNPDRDNDSNSDTGLSSLHSDESIPNPILETLV